mgnify:CR=1 FL=1|jgi:hypothetical protein
MGRPSCLRVRKKPPFGGEGLVDVNAKVFSGLGQGLVVALTLFVAGPVQVRRDAGYWVEGELASEGREAG